MERMGQDTEGGFQGGIFSGQSMDTEGKAVCQDTAGLGGWEKQQGGQLPSGSRPMGYAGWAHGNYCEQAAGITGMPSICDYGDSSYSGTGSNCNYGDSPYGGTGSNCNYGGSPYGDTGNSSNYGDGAYHDRGNRHLDSVGSYNYGNNGYNDGNYSNNYMENRYNSGSYHYNSRGDSYSYGSNNYTDNYNNGNNSYNDGSSYYSYGNNICNDEECYPNYQGNFYHNSHNIYGNGGREAQELYGCQGCQEYLKQEQGRLNRWQPDRLSGIIVAVMGMGLMFMAFLATLFFLICVAAQRPSAVGKSGETLVYEGTDVTEPLPQDGPKEKEPDLAWQDMEPEKGAEGEYYGELRDAVRTDLAYSVEWENYEYEGNSDMVMIAVDYPVLEGEVPNIEVLNDVIASEVDYFEEYYNEYSNYMLEDEVFAVYSEGYVTYMDEEVMSIVFAENIYTDYWADTGLYCVNIDIENGVILDNSSILDVDDEFAIDFRTRSREQNGDVSVLEYLTDQEVAYYLTDGSTGIIFYTPLGMEIGLNYGEDYVTVTYRDYREFLLRY